MITYVALIHMSAYVMFDSYMYVTYIYERTYDNIDVVHYVDICRSVTYVKYM